MPRTIVHVDLDAFYCSIEEQRDPSLRGRPFAVGARPEDRGVVASCSYAARRQGVRSAMPTSHALRLCPSLRIVPSRHAVYRAVSRQVMARLRAITPLVQPLSIDEAFLDVSSLMPRGGAELEKQQARASRALARRLQNQIERELGLRCSLGVASNKLVAKIANDCGKAAPFSGHSPRALCIVPPGQEEAFLAPLPASALWGVGPKTEERLAAMKLATIGDIAACEPRDLLRALGSHGYELWQHARGIDKREVETTREAKSISSETTFSNDLSDWDSLQQIVEEQSASVARVLQRQKLQATTVKIKLRRPDFSTPTRQATLDFPTDRHEAIRDCALQLLRASWSAPQPVRLLGVGVSGLSAVRQLGLWEPTREPVAEEDAPRAEREEESEAAREFQSKQQRIWEAVSLLQNLYGTHAVQLGADEPAA